VEEKMQQLAVVRLNVYPTHNQGESTVALSYPSEIGPCIERLQQEIAHLLIRNQTIRFELLAAHQKIAGIGRALFGAGAGKLDTLLPPDRLRLLRDLCQIADGDEDSRSLQLKML
jgi:hypothetical protein